MAEVAANYALFDHLRLIQALEEYGYYMFNAESAVDTESIIEELSHRLNEEVFSAWHSLMPSPSSCASPVSYSGLFGLEKFPFHTDMAHWKRPPRYLVLLAENGVDDVTTPIIDSQKLVEKIGRRTLNRALVRPRRPVRGKLPLMRLLDASNDNNSIFRWDSVFLTPASPAGEAGFSALSTTIGSERAYELRLSNKGIGVVIDNWRILHGRSAVSTKDKGRIILRAYLGRAE